MASIKFSIIIPTYNRAQFILNTLNSALNQDLPLDEYEIIVVDDGSTDNTENLVNALQNSKIFYYKITNGERAKARNFGIRKAKGNFITFLDSDDLLYPNYLSTALKLIKRYPNGVFFSLGYEVINSQKKVLHQINNRKGCLNKQLTTGNHLSCIGVFIKHDILLGNLFNETRELSGSEDYELWLRIASQQTILYDNTIVCAIVNHEERSVFSFNKKKLIDRMIILENSLKGNSQIVSFYTNHGIKKIMAHSWLYVALHLAISKKRKAALSFFFKAAFLDWKAIMTYKAIVVLKKIFF